MLEIEDNWHGRRISKSFKLHWQYSFKVKMDDKCFDDEISHTLIGDEHTSIEKVEKTEKT